ncbi:MAG: S41 family peptidase, partial [Planctomycetaceae bacterium]|nr:S41 family peptidase [Planctomycetaceae bacterium]
LLSALVGTADSAWAVNKVADVRDPQTAAAQGVALEQGNRWRDAIEHYKGTLEKFPDDPQLTYGLRRARIHFSIERRYSDESFKATMLKLSRHDALELYDAILDRIRSNYVDDISTTSIVAHGTESLWLALSNEKFVDQHLFGADPKRVQKLRELLHQQYWNKPVYFREGARQIVTEIADRSRELLGLSDTSVILEFVFGACNCLDEYSSVLTPSRNDDLHDNMKGEFVGIGIVMEAELGQGMALRNVLPESPASEAGIRPGDHLVRIDDRDCRFMTTEEAAGLLTGSPGSQVRLHVSSPRKEDAREVTCVRRKVEVKSVPVAKIIDQQQGIAYIQQTGFQESTAFEMQMALHKLHREGMRSLIWDVRGNPGGLLQQAADVLDLFITSGVLVSTKGRTPDQNQQFTAHAPGTWDVPLVLLIDENSASASEIVAGAVRDHKRGTIVGRKSYGKWSVQSIYPVRGGTGLRLTTAKFLSPNGHWLSKIGVKPDVSVEWPDDSDFVRPLGDVDLVQDLDLVRALDVIQNGNALTRR